MGCNPSDEELQEMIAEMDEDNSGTVDFEVESSEDCSLLEIENTWL